MICVGVDSAPIAKSSVLPNGTRKGEFVANLGVSVTTHNRDKFESAYDDAIADIFRKRSVERKKRIYKGAHLVAQTMENAPMIISELIDLIEEYIAHIDVYCAYYAREYIAIYGQAEVQRLSPPVFIKKTQGAFPHVCAWWYTEKYASSESPLGIEIDYFQTATTPGWRKLLEATKKGASLEFYFGGDECNPLISMADLILKLIRIYHQGNVDGRSLIAPLHERCDALRGKRKTWFHNLGAHGFLIKATAPDLPLQADARRFIKHPICFYSWNPGSADKKREMKTGFEWTPVYNAIAAYASQKRGGMKSFSFSEDAMFWDSSTDIIFPVTKEDLEDIQKLEEYGHKLPKIVNPQKLI